MKRKFGLNTALAGMALMAMVMAGCSQSYPGETYVYDTSGNPVNEEGRGDEMPAEVRVYATNRYFFSVMAESGKKSPLLNHGSGPIEKPSSGETEEDQLDFLRRLRNKDFNIFAFRYGKNAQGPQSTDANLQMTTNAQHSPSAYYDVMGDHVIVDNPKDYLQGMYGSIEAGAPHDPETAYRFVLYDVPLPAPLEDGEGNLNPAARRDSTTLYYPTMYQETGYNFFGYAFDDAKILNPTSARQEDHITYDIEIDGVLVIMMGYAPALGENEETGKEVIQQITGKDYSEMTDDEITTAKESDAYRRIMNSGSGYSAYSSRRGIHPIIELKHCLTRLNFAVRPAASTAVDVVIDSVLVWSPYQGTVRVAARTNSFEELRNAQFAVWKNDEADRFKFTSDTTFSTPTYKWLGLRGESANGYDYCSPMEDFDMGVLVDEEGNPIDEAGNPVEGPDLGLVPYTIDAKSGQRVPYKWDNSLKFSDRPQHKFDGSLLVPETDSIAIMICWHQATANRETVDGSDGTVTRPKVVYNSTMYRIGVPVKEGEEPKSFERGKYYNIIIGVYGMEKILIMANIEGWEDGGEVPIDPDEQEPIWQ